MHKLHTKNGASPTNLLAFMSWAELFIGPKLWLRGMKMNPDLYRMQMHHFAVHVGVLPGMRDVVFEVDDLASVDLAMKCFPKLFYAPGTRSKQEAPARTGMANA